MHPWPMSLISAVFGTEDDEEIQGHLGALINVGRVYALTARPRRTNNGTDWLGHGGHVVEHRRFGAHT